MNTLKAKTYDVEFLSEEKWLTKISGFSQSHKLVYNLYRIFLFSVLFYMLFMEILACIFKPEKQLMLEGTHYLLGTFCGLWALTSRLLAHRSLGTSGELMKSGVYIYDNEEQDVDLIKLKELISKEISAKSKVFTAMFIMGPLSNAILFPVTNALLLEPDSLEDSIIVNPYLPHIFYQPFDTSSGLGFVCGALLGFLYFYCLYAVIVGSNWIYINCAIQLKIHFRMLNHSIKNIQKRACLLYSKDEKLCPSKSPELQGLIRGEKFERCLFLCLKSNVQHHQAVLRLMKASEPFCGSYLLDIFALASLVFGVQLYLINQNPPVGMMISLVASFVAEQFTVVYLCSLGEDITEESRHVFNRLYRIPWFNYSKRFNRILHIMMTNTLKPMQLKAMVFGVPASLEVYGHIVSAMYKITNLVRQSDIV